MSLPGVDEMQILTLQKRVRELEAALKPFAQFRHPASGGAVIVSGPWRIENNAETRSLITGEDIEQARQAFLGNSA